MVTADKRVGLIREAYAAFNRRDIDATLTLLDPNVEWPNVAAGSVLRGHAAIRDYWADQFRRSDPHVEPSSFAWHDDTLVVTVHQVVRDLTGNVVLEGTVQHAYTFRGDRVRRMEVR